jgi:hypothetical protein
MVAMEYRMGINKYKQVLVSAFINRQSSRGDTALHQAVKHQQLKTIDWLLKPSPVLTDELEHDALALPSMSILNVDHLTAFTLAARQGDLKIMKRLIDCQKCTVWKFGPVALTQIDLEQIDTFRILDKRVKDNGEGSDSSVEDKVQASDPDKEEGEDYEREISWPVPRLALKCDTKTWGSASGLLQAMARDRTPRTAGEWAARSQSHFCSWPSSESVSMTEAVLPELARVHVVDEVGVDEKKRYVVAGPEKEAGQEKEGQEKEAKRKRKRRAAMENFFFTLAEVAQGRFEHWTLHQNPKYISALELVVRHNKDEFITELEDLPDLHENLTDINVLMTPPPPKAMKKKKVGVKCQHKEILHYLNRCNKRHRCASLNLLCKSWILTVIICRNTLVSSAHRDKMENICSPTSFLVCAHTFVHRNVLNFSASWPSFFFSFLFSLRQPLAHSCRLIACRCIVLPGYEFSL